MFEAGKLFRACEEGYELTLTVLHSQMLDQWPVI
jgi:hypothetical protein